AEIKRAIDQLRSGDQQQPAPEAQQIPQAQPVEQPAQQPPANIDLEVWQALQSNPKLLNAVSEMQALAANHIAFTEQEGARKLEAAQRQYTDGIMQNAQLLVAHIQARNPELRVPIENWAAVIQSLGQSNPTRAQQIQTELLNTQNFFNQAAQAETVRQQAAVQQLQQQQAMARYQWEQAAADADAKYDDW